MRSSKIAVNPHTVNSSPPGMRTSKAGGAVRGAAAFDVGGVPVGGVQQIAHRNPRDEGRFVAVDHA